MSKEKVQMCHKKSPGKQLKDLKQDQATKWGWGLAKKSQMTWDGDQETTKPAGAKARTRNTFSSFQPRELVDKTATA